MKTTTIGCLMLGSAPCLVQAVEAPVAYRELASLLRQEEVLLASVQDAATAAAVVPQLARVLEALAAMGKQQDSSALWEYMDNTAGAKAPLVELLQRLAAQFSRLEQAQFWGCAELHDLLRPQLEKSAPED